MDKEIRKDENKISISVKQICDELPPEKGKWLCKAVMIMIVMSWIGGALLASALWLLGYLIF